MKMTASSGRFTKPHQLARSIKAFSGFYYAYTTIYETDGSFVVNYIDYPKSKNDYKISAAFKSCSVKNEDNEVLLSPKN